METFLHRIARMLGKFTLATALTIFFVPVFAQEHLDSEYRIAAGDSVRVVVFGHDDLSGDCKVDGAGRCSLPLIISVDAAGLTALELELVITGQLQPDYLKNPRVNVEITDYRPIYVLGEVRVPGSYPYSAGMTVVNAIALAGGYSHRAARSKIDVIKAADTEKIKQSTREEDERAPGDVIEIHERFF